MKKLTILLTLWNPRKEEIEYWTNVYLKLKRHLSFQWLIDNPNLSLDDDRIDENDIFINDENLGKLSTVYNHIKKGNVKTEYFKTVDPDDYISIEKIINFPFPKNNNSIITFNSTKIFGRNVLTQEQIENEIERQSKIKTFIPSYGTSYTILPTLPIKSDIYFSGNRIDADEDQILGYLAYVNGGEIIKIDWSFYLYQKFVGQTSPKNFDKLIVSLEKAYEEYDSIYEKTGKVFGYNFKSIQNHIFNLKDEYENEFGKIDSNKFGIFLKIMKHRPI